MTKWISFETENAVFDTRDFEIFINKIERPLMPPIETTAKTIGKRAGAYLEENALGVLEIKVEMTLMSDNQASHRKDIREIARNLYDSGEGTLYISDEPDRFYKAQLTGAMDMDSFASLGEFTINFICGEPFAYSATEMTIGQNANLVPRPEINSLNYNAWYANLEFTEVTNAEGTTSGRATMVDFASNPRFRVLQNFDNRTIVEGGKKYTFTFIFTPSEELTTLEYLSYIEYQPDGTYQWVNFPIVALNTLERIESLNAYKYTVTFTANIDGEIRFSIGYGPWNNTLMGNGTYTDIHFWKVEEGETSTENPTGAFSVFNDGSYKTYPIIRAVPQADTTYIKIKNTTTNETMLLTNDFKAKEAIIINHEINLIYKEKTGERIMKALDLTSDFWSLKASNTNNITFEPATQTTQIIFRERYL